MFMPPVFPAHWHVSQPVLIADTFSSLVWKVSLPDGTPAIVKGLKPIKDIADELRGADYLVWRNGRGAVRLLGRENNLMLLEYAGERMLSHIVAEHGDYQATEIAAELMAKLYAASEEPLPSALLPIRDRFAALFQRARSSFPTLDFSLIYPLLHQPSENCKSSPDRVRRTRTISILTCPARLPGQALSR